MGSEISDTASQTAPVSSAWSARTAETALSRYQPEAALWHYEHGLLLKALAQVGERSGDGRYAQFVQAIVDRFVTPAGELRSYRLADYNLDQINPGKNLFAIYRRTGADHYRKALSLLRQQLAGQPRNSSGGFWHKLIYPQQMWLDGLYMAAPFYAEFARTFDEPAAFEDIAHQFELIEQHARDPQTGLLYHAWDESRAQAWANPQTGCSPQFWGRAMGWYAMALVDTLELFPAGHSGRTVLQASLGRVAEAVTGVQDSASGLWYQVLDQRQRADNYRETSASAMFVYALLKGVRLGWLPEGYRPAARQGYWGLLKHMVSLDAAGQVNLAGICAVAGLGGQPYRDGSYTYYVSQRPVANDYKGVGPFILAALEIEMAGLE